MLTRLIVRDELHPVQQPFGVERFNGSVPIAQTSMQREQRSADR
jgi:hypothetical protein